ncbi:MAG: hypothetical protein ABII89_01870 [Candidatus Omnitrophota bacterium]
MGQINKVALKILRMLTVAGFVVFNQTSLVSANNITDDGSLRLLFHFDENEGWVTKDSNSCGSDGRIVRDCVWASEKHPEDALVSIEKFSQVRAAEEEISLRQNENVALRKKYTFSLVPNYWGSKDDGDMLQLTDGKYASVPYEQSVDKGNFWTQKPVVGWHVSLKPLEIKIDLGTVYPISEVIFSTASRLESEVGFPLIEVLVSDDDAIYTLVGKISDENLVIEHLDPRQEYRRKLRTGDMKTRGRYVLLCVVPDKGSYVFCDEIEIIKSDRDSDKVNLDGLPRFTLEQISKRGDRALQIKRSAEIMRLNLRTIRENLEQAKLSEKTAALTENELKKLEDDVKSSAATLMTEELVDSFNRRIVEISSRINQAIFPETPYVVWYKNLWEDFTPYELPQPTGLPFGEISIFMGKNEYEPAAFMITNTADKDVTVKIEIPDILDKYKQKMINIDVRYSVFVQTSALKLLVADALPSALVGGANYVTVPQGQTRQIWLTLKTDERITPGEYKIKVHIVSDSGSKFIAIKSVVYPLVLPDTDRFTALNVTWGSISNLSKIETIVPADLLSHHVNCIPIYCPPDAQPRFDKDGNIVKSADYSKIDNELNLYGNNVFYLFYWYGWKPGSEQVKLYSGLEYLSPEWKKAFKSWVSEFVGHLTERGINYGNFAFYPCDEPNTEDLKKFFMESAAQIKETDPKINIFVTMNFRDWSFEDLNKSLPYADIYCFCPFWQRIADLKKIALLKNANKITIAYNSPCANKWESPTVGFRVIFWQAWSWGLDGYGTWRYYNKTGDSVWDDFDGTRGDEAFVYDGKNAPFRTAEEIIPSKRWEAYREGIEDWEYLHMLKAVIAESEKKGISKSTVEKAREALKEEVDKLTKKIDGTPVSTRDKIDPMLVDKARQKIAEEIISMEQLLQ